MKTQALSLKIWGGIILGFIVVEYLACLYFEERIFYPRDSLSISDGQFYRLERDFQNTTSDELKVAVIGSSRVAKGIECPDEIRNILAEKGMPPIQLNKIWESFDPFEIFVEHKKFLKRLLPLKPDLICIQADMIAIQIPISAEQNSILVEEKYKKRWELDYEGDKEKYISKKLKYQSKVNQELVYKIINAHSLYQGNGPCTIRDNYANIDTLIQITKKRNVKKMEDIRYTIDDLEKLKNAGIKVAIIESPFPLERENLSRTPTFTKNLQSIKKEFKEKFNIDYWEYTGPPLYYRYYVDRGHLNPEGRLIYTEWLLEKIHKEIPAQ